MFEKVLIFVIFLGPLIFFHELGHFLFARLFGVRVEVFSIGFGPKIFKVIKGGTQYAISIIPLGGYVKMFGDDPFSEVPLSDEEKKVAFNHKSKWARFWIVFGGPMANLILAYFIYVGLLVGGEKVPETKVGVVSEKSVLFEKGLRTGDVLIKINDEKILSFDDFNIKGSSVETITVKRQDQEVTFQISLGLENFVKEFVGLVSGVRRPIIVNAKGEQYYLSPVEKPKTLDFSLEQILGENYIKFYLYKFKQDGEEFVLDFATESGLVVTPGDTLIEALRESGFFLVENSVRGVVSGSPADKAGIKKGDILIKLQDKQVLAFEDLRSSLQNIPDAQEVSVTVISDQKEMTKTLIPSVDMVENLKVKKIGIESSVFYVPPKLIVAKEDNVGMAILTAFSRTWDGVLKTISGYKKLITREVALNNIGGPIAIGKVASDSFNISLSMFFRLMAIISINLGVINLFPIPVLDGGHIMFLAFEAFNRGPLSRRKLELAQRLGVSVLFFLIFVALFNDITRLF